MSHINDIPKDNPFKMPDGYFDDFSRDLETKIKEEYIREICGKDLPFELPEQYFEKFSENLNSKLHSPDRTRTDLIRRLALYPAAAAVLLLLIMLWQGLLENQAPQDETIITAKAEDPNSNSTDKSDTIALAKVLITDEIAEEIAEDMNFAELTEILPEDETAADTTNTMPADDEYTEALEEYLADNVAYTDLMAEL